ARGPRAGPAPPDRAPRARPAAAGDRPTGAGGPAAREPLALVVVDGAGRGGGGGGGNGGAPHPQVGPALPDGDHVLPPVQASPALLAAVLLCACQKGSGLVRIELEAETGLV